jgi:hypothetical protein
MSTDVLVKPLQIVDFGRQIFVRYIYLQTQNVGHVYFVKMKQRGSLIVFEGLDRCGKTSQIQMLKDKFQTENMVHYNFPNRTTVIGQILDSYLRCKSETEDHAIHLLFAANRWEMRLTS